MKGIFGHHDCRPGGGWGPRGQECNTGGIWNHVSLMVAGETRLTQVHVTPVLGPDHRSADLHLEVTAHHAGKHPVAATVEAVIRPGNFAPGPHEPAEVTVRREVRLQPGENRLRLTTTLEQPQLWWTWDHGAPHLYEATATVQAGGAAADQREVTFGIRSIRRDEDWTWYLNGRRIFLRGSNYIPSQWLAEMDQARFYRAADAAGVLVWQDFPLRGATPTPRPSPKRRCASRTK